MPSCTGGIKASTGEAAASHSGFVGYACQTISKTGLVLQLTVWHNRVIIFLICSLLLQGSTQPCVAEYARAWGSVRQQQPPEREHPTPQCGEHRRLPQGLSCRSPRPPQQQRLRQPLPSGTCNWEQHLAFWPQWAAQHPIFISRSRQKTVQRNSMLSTFKVNGTSVWIDTDTKQALSQPPKPVHSWRNSWLYNYIGNHFFKVYQVFFPHAGNKKGISH